MPVYELLLQFIVEILRALLTDELSERVRGGLRRVTAGRKRRRRSLQVILQRRNRDRLLHNLSAAERHEP
jgi:hypothetical protein